MKAGRSFVPLAQLCDFVTVGHVGITSPYYCEVGVPFLRTQNVGAGTVDLSDLKFITPEFHDSLRKTQLKPGDLLLSRVVTDVMKCAIVPPSVTEANCANVILIRPNHNLSSRFLLHLINSPIAQQYLLGKRVGSAQQVVNTGVLKAWLVPNLSLDEQKHIVEVLDAAFEGLSRARAHTQTNLENARELFERVSGGLLAAKSEGWAEKTLSQVCEKITDGTHQTPTYFEDGVIFLSSRNVTSRKIDWDNVKYIDDVQHLAMHKRVSPRKGDILLAKNGTTGVAAIVDRDEIFDIYVSLAHLRPLQTLEPEFLLYFLNSGAAKAQFNSRLKGQGVPNLHLQEIREVRMSFPNSRNEQLRIVDEVKELDSQVDELQSHYRAKLADLDQLRQALLQKAFAGELT